MVPKMADRMMRRPEVESVTGLSCSTIYEWMSKGKFPLPVALGSKAVAWRKSDVDAWIESLETKSREVKAR
jgi:prophage regulatory protein